MKKTLTFLIYLLFPLLVSGQDPFYFVQLTDPQFGMFEGNKEFVKETALMEKAVGAINKLSPRFVVVTGDLVNDGNNPEQIKEFKRICSLIRKDIPVYLTPGNHDVGQQPTKESLKNYRDEYGYDCFSFQVNGTCFIGLNTQIIWTGLKDSEDSQFVWLNKVLENSQKCNHRIVFGHHPLFVNSIDEPDKYENFPTAKRNTYIGLFEKYNVGNMFAGHLHHNASGQIGQFKMNVTSALGMQIGKDKSGIRIVKVYPDHVESDYFQLDSIPDRIDL